MSTRRGARGRGRGRGSVRAESSASGHVPNVGVEEASTSPMVENGQYDRAMGDDVLSQAMLRILERVVGPNNGTGNRGSILERLRSNGAEIFKGVLAWLLTGQNIG